MEKKSLEDYFECTLNGNLCEKFGENTLNWNEEKLN